MNRQILRLTIPNIISNITVPLLGMVDIAIAGHLESALYIGAMSLGTTILNMIYWNFGFLRMSTSGFTSQAYGARNFEEVIGILGRALLVALFFGVLIVMSQYFIVSLSFRLIGGSDEMRKFVLEYFNICIWGTPAMLGLYVFNGWFIGMQNARTPMIVAILNNLINIVLSAVFVFVFEMQLAGIAFGTLLSQWVTLVIMVVIWKKYYGRLMCYFSWRVTVAMTAFKHFFSVNFDIFIRTLLLVLVISFFTFTSSVYGDSVLSANTLLMQFFMFFSYFMDGFAYAGEALTGKFVGRKNRGLLNEMIKKLFLWGVGVSVVFTLLFLFFNEDILSILTDKTGIITVAQEYLVWIVVIPFVSFSAFVWDGVFIGATASVQMRNSMLIAVVVFFAVYYSLASLLENNALWLSFVLFLALRGVVQTLMARKALKG